MRPILLKKAFNVFSDERGYLNPLDLKELQSEPGLEGFEPAFQLMSWSHEVKTFRGFHYQTEPHAQAKLVLLHSGRVCDFVVPYKKPVARDVLFFELQAGDALFVPNNYAHAFLTQTTDVSLQYLIDHPFNAESYTGINGCSFIEQFLGNDEFLVSEKDSSFKQSIT